MTTFVPILLRLYPRGWRARYEAELLALLADRDLTLSAVPDIVLAALDARLSGDYPSGASDDREARSHMPARIAPLALVTGGALLVLTIAGAVGLGDQDWVPPLGYLLLGFPIGFGMLAAGIAGVVVGRYTGRPVTMAVGLLSAGLAAAVAATLVMLVVAGDGFWGVMTIAFMAFAIVSGVFGLLVATLDSGARFAGLLLVTGIVGTAIATGVSAGVAPDLGPIPVAETLMALLLLGWTLLGVIEYRRAGTALAG